MQCSNPANPWGNIEIRLRVVGTNVSDVVKNTHTHKEPAKRNLTDHVRPTYDPLTTKKATTMELQRHHDGDELVVLNEHSSFLFSLLTSLDDSLLSALSFLPLVLLIPRQSSSPSGVFKCLCILSFVCSCGCFSCSCPRSPSRLNTFSFSRSLSH